MWVWTFTASGVLRDSGERGVEIGRGQVPTSFEGYSSMRARHRLDAGTPVALESGTVAFYAARELVKVELSPVVVDAHEVRAKARRRTQKSDTRDAEALCEGIRRDSYESIVHVPPPRIERLRNTLSRRRHFVRLETAEVNAAKKMLRAAGLGELSRQSLGTAGAWGRLLERLCGQPEVAAFVELHGRVWEKAEEQKSLCEESLREQSAQFRERFEAEGPAGLGGRAGSASEESGQEDFRDFHRATTTR